ncbi:hypothetical protein ACHQM5_019401 [Ranunculus cassubicifolius]
MSIAPTTSYPSLCSSPPLPRTSPSKSLLFPPKHSSFLNTSSISISITKEPKPSKFLVKASVTESSEPPKSESEGEGDGKDDIYEVELDPPYGLKFAKGRDGGTYIDAIAPGGSADKTNMFTVGDKVIATSAIFGTEIWPAAEYGRTMYTIRGRVGPLFCCA